MNLETVLEPQLWEVIREHVEARKFKSAILDAIHFLTDVIRERSEEDGDGVALVGAAFGGDTPKLKVTKRLQTDTEKNMQAGTADMLRGLYRAVRNPRSHEMLENSERDANALLLFIDYLLRVVGKSRSPFSVATLVERVLDPDFVPSEKYAKLLVDEIPPKKRLPVCRELFLRRDELDDDKVRHFFETLLNRLADEEKKDFCELVTHELRTTTEEATILFVLRAFPPTLWPQIDEVARIRIEHKLIASVKEGKWIGRMNRCRAGALGTWLTNIISVITLRMDLWIAVYGKLESEDAEEQDYAFRFFTSHLDRSFREPSFTICRIVNKGLKAGDPRFHELAVGWTIDGNLENRAADHPWVKPFAEALANFQEKQETPSEADTASEYGTVSGYDTAAGYGGEEIPF